MSMSRRTLLSLTAGAGACLSFPVGAFAQSGAESPRFVLVILRGGLDGLAAAPALGDPAFETARAGLAPPRSGDEAPLPLDGLFGLHPRMVNMAERYAAGEMILAHAVATSYRDRSHFDAQNVLETGAGAPFARSEGWLNLALGAAPRPAGPAVRELGVALSQQIPLVIRGPTEVATWSPSRLPDPDGGTLERLMRLYAARDPALATALQSGMMTDEIAMAAGADGMSGGGRQTFAPMMRAAAAFLTTEGGPVCAVLEAGGWDTHANQGLAQGALARGLADLDVGIAALRETLGPVWRRTVVAVVTEFGRTVARNGGGGTDHGTGAAAFLVGGAVAGGRVLADWPGLGQRDLLEGRDLRPTLHLASLLKGVLADHMRVPDHRLAAEVFPGLTDAPKQSGLIRA